MSRSAKIYAYSVIAAGGVVLLLALSQWSSQRPAVWLAYLAFVALASLVKLRLPQIDGTYSLNSLVLLYGLVRFSLGEMVVAGCLAVAVQTLLGAQKRPRLIQVLFNMANVSLSLGGCFLVTQVAPATGLDSNPAALMSAVAVVYFVVNTLLVSGVLSLLQGKTLSQTCSEWYLWSFPYYLVGAALVGLMLPSGIYARGEGWLILLPLGYLIHFFSGLSKRDGSQNVESRANTTLPRAARFYLAAVLAAGGCLLWAAVVYWQTQDARRFALYMILAVAASTLKIRLPGLTTTLSPNFVILLLAIAQLSFSECAVIAMAAAVTQSLWKPRHWPKPEQLLFNASGLCLSTVLSYVVCNRVFEDLLSSSVLGYLTLATLVLYVANTLVVAAILCLADRKPLHRCWQLCHFWSFPYFLVGAAAAGTMLATSGPANWTSSLPILLSMTLVFVSYRTHLVRAT